MTTGLAAKLFEPKRVTPREGKTKGSYYLIRNTLSHQPSGLQVV